MKYIALFFFLLASHARAVPAQGHKIMVAGASPYAVEVARAISDKGGNAADVACAIALSLAVTHPYYAAFGGGGLAVLKVNGQTTAIDFREKAPLKAAENMFKGAPPARSRTGGLAIAVPGIPAGLWEIHQKFGKLRWKELFVPILPLAERGFRVSGEWFENTEHTKARFTAYGLKHFGKVLRPGETLKQPGLAGFLRSYRDRGPQAFYQGAVAQEIADAVKASSGLITTTDLASYHVRWLEPMKTQFNGYQLILMPPPSSGGVIAIQALRLMEKLQLDRFAFQSVDEFHRVIEILKLSYRGRMLLGDPDMSRLPIAQLTGDSYLESQAKLFDPLKSIAAEKLPELNFEKEQTTHVSVIDHEGNAVAMTLTLNGDYGSAVVTPKTGIVLNNEMDDFTTQIGKPNMFGLIQGAANLVRPGARPLSSMTPTLAEKDGQVVLAIGAPGGPRITSAVIQVIYRILKQNLDVDSAIQAPRVHHQFSPNEVRYDELRFTPETLAALKAKGHLLKPGSTARVAAVVRRPDGTLLGACDSRGECAAGGY